MDPGDPIAAVIFVSTGVGTMWAGRRVATGGRTDLVFAPGVDAPDERVIREGSRATVLAGALTVALGVAVLFVPATGPGWAVLLGSYTVACLGVAIGTWRRLRAAD